NAEIIAAIDYLNRECFIQFPQIDVCNLEAMPRKQFWNGINGADSHFVWGAACHYEAAKNQLIGNAQLIRSFARHQKRCRRAIGKLRRISGRYGTLSASGIEHRFKRKQSVERGLGAIALISVAG